MTATEPPSTLVSVIQPRACGSAELHARILRGPTSRCALQAYGAAGSADSETTSGSTRGDSFQPDCDAPVWERASAMCCLPAPSSGFPDFARPGRILNDEFT